MFKNYLKIAIRNIWRQKFHSFVNIFGFAVGLTTVLLITLFISHELSFDRFHQKANKLFRVVENQYYSGQPVFPVAVTPVALGPSLHEEYPEIVNFTRFSGRGDYIEYQQKKFLHRGAYVDPGFLEMFSFELLEGNHETALDKLNSIIITQELDDKFFPDEEPIGKLLTLDDEVFEVTGVLENFPDNSHIEMDFLVPFAKMISENPGLETNWRSNQLYTYVELTPNAKLEDINQKIIGQIKKNNERSVTDIYLQPITNIHLGEVDFTVDVRKGEMQYVQIFSMVAVFILLIACINFMNLSTAQSVKRAKEVGLRKAVGALKTQLIVQFLGESIFITLIAVLLALLFTDLLLPSFNELAGKELDLNILSSWENGLKWLLGILAVAVITGLIAGSYPALVLSSFLPARVLKATSTTDKRGSRFRKVLVTIQFTVSLLLIVGTLIVYQQLNFIRGKNLGYDKENVILLPQLSENYQAFRNELINQSPFIDIAASNRHPTYVLSSTSGFSWPGKDPDESILIHYQGVDPHYISTMMMVMDRGRAFSETEPSDSSAIIINQVAAKIMNLEEPIGQIITAGRQELTIIGVVQDFHFKSIHTTIEPIILHLTDDNLNRIFIRINSNSTEEAIALIQKTWKKLNPEREIIYNFLVMNQN